MTDPTDDQKRLAKVAKLVEAIKHHHDKEAELFLELDALIKSEPGHKSQSREVIAAFCEAWKKRYGDTCVIEPKDAAAFTRITKALGSQEVIRRIDQYIRDESPFVCETRHLPWIFCSQINKWGWSFREAFARPANCLHTPTCTNDSQHTHRVQQELRGEAH